MEVTLHHGDCLEVMKSIPDGSVDAVITDPPYGVGLNYEGYEDSADAYIDMMLAFMPEALRVSRKCVALTPGMKHLNWWFVSYPPDWVCAWLKLNQCSRNSYGGFNVWEPILYWARGGTQIKQDGFSRSIRMQPEAAGHPCPKELGAWLTLIDRLDGKQEINTILDPFMGSGTTGVACMKSGRNFIGIEIERKYYDIAEKRIAEAQMQPLLMT
jgi:site-specific DNA-methyltransferase (adenine-specific)